MELVVGIVSCTPSLLAQAIKSAASTASKPLSVAIHANGFQPDVEALRALAPLDRVLVSTSDGNIGVTKGLHRIWEICRDAGNVDVLSYQHDDVDIFERDWDARVLRRFAVSPRCGLATFGGARGLGSPELYREGYAMHQLARQHFMSNMRSAAAHGHRVTEEQRIATPDGFSMILRMELLNHLGGWAWFPYPHHTYDNGMACQARRAGWEAWLIPVDCEHYGGRTSIQPSYVEWVKQFGGNAHVHSESHLWLYNHFRDVLPFSV